MVCGKQYMNWTICFSRLAFFLLLAALTGKNVLSQAAFPNVILMMADDLGWGDVAYNGHPDILTPNLDSMAAAGIRFDRFYSASAVCSPTRASVLTGRHPNRMGITYANVGSMPDAEITIAEAVKTMGYTTGHFGKWHLGTINPDYSRYAPPDQHGYDYYLATEKAIPTYDPYTWVHWSSGQPQREPIDIYWENGEPVCQRWNGCDAGYAGPIPDLYSGDDSRIIMDHVLGFIGDAVNAGTPFLTTIWFHAPHRQVEAGPEYLAMYAGHPVHTQHYYGCITAMDEQIGRLREGLRDYNIADNTMVWFCSDNGPETGQARDKGSAGPFLGRKQSLHEGGVRVPGILEWPSVITRGRTTEFPAFTSDYYPTILDAIGFRIIEQTAPMDGISLMPLITDTLPERGVPLAFSFQGQEALMDDTLKIYRTSNGEWELYNLINDKEETTNLALQYPETVAAMRGIFEEWNASETVFPPDCCTPELTRDTTTGVIYVPAPAALQLKQEIIKYDVMGKRSDRKGARNAVIQHTIQSGTGR